jgi:cytochrome c oxidase cbb3-type subunit III
MASEKHFDEVTGTHTTGHVWDGDLRELNKPLPRWWLYVLYASIVWAIGYWIAYPAWPTLSGYTKGYLGYSQRAEVASDVATARAAQDQFRQKIGSTALADIRKDQNLMQFAMAGGAAVFGDNCAGCHGRGAQGSVGYPNLNDDDWIWGGSLESIHKTISYGIRSGHKDAHDSAMPRFGLDGVLDAGKIADTADYVRSLSGLPVDKDAVQRGAAVFAENCAVCHGGDGKGNQELGAPNLTDAIWLYGPTHDAIATSVKTGRGGIMPAWEGRLDPASIKMLSVYVHALGGGK